MGTRCSGLSRATWVSDPNLDRLIRNAELQFAESQPGFSRTDAGARQVSRLKLETVSERLASAAGVAAACQAIQEIAANLVGCEQFAIVALYPGVDVLAYCEIEPEALHGISEHEMVARVIETRVLWAVRPGTREYLNGHSVSACVPLLHHGRVAGVLVLFDLLPHKQTLESCDLATLLYLQMYAASALGLGAPAAGGGQ